MTKKENPPLRLSRYFSVLCKQALLNFQFIYFWIIGVTLHIAIIQTVHWWAWLLIAIFDLLIGICAIASIVRPVDKAFESIGLNFDKGYGRPYWIVDERFPLKAESYRINAAGYSPDDFKPYLAQLASRLKQPIKAITKPSPYHSVLEVALKRSEIPRLLPYEDLPLDQLGQGEFFIGKSDDGFEKLELSKMIHMLVAGQTGGGKTQFLKQFLATILSHTRHAHVCLIDMKGGIDFQNFRSLQNFELAKNYDEAAILVDQVVKLYELRRDYLNRKKKTQWKELSITDLSKDEDMRGVPVGPVLVVVDELAELSKVATKNTAGKDLQEKISTLARLSRVTGIFLTLGTQRPSKSIISMDSKDNLQTRICYSVPSVAASNLVVGDMSATTLGSHPGRAVYQLNGTKIVQTPFLDNTKLSEMMSNVAERQRNKNESRSVHGISRQSSSGETRKDIK